jgi:2-phospho-L-lactate guanylyltransferase (CobY/MobA/RfbA family)
VFQRAVSEAKSRLGTLLAAPQRALFVQACLRSIAVAAAPLSTVVLAEDTSVEAIARDLGLPTLSQTDPDVNVALAAALSELAGRSSGGVLVVPADLPFFRVPTDLGPVGAVAPDHHLLGTTALWLPEPTRGFAFAFGPKSLQAHLASLRATYGTARLLGNRFLLDLDTTEDLELAHALVALDPELTWPNELNELLAPAR